MASEVDICNLALAHLGDSATVASINPPEGSAQAEMCQRFYPIARDSLLEMHNWGFATRRKPLAQLNNTSKQWKYAYIIPGDMQTALSVIPPDAEDDYSTSFYPSDSPVWGQNFLPAVAAGQYVPQPYTIETDTSGNLVILTNLEKAVLRYQARVTDTTKFSALFTVTLSWHLAGMLAGPVIKGDAGQAEAKRCGQMMAAYLLQASANDSNQRKINVEHIVPWTSGR
jgi:hypothetical protein